MTSLRVVKGGPDDDELAAVVAAFTILAGRRSAAGRREAAAARNAAATWAWRRALRTGGHAPAGVRASGPDDWRTSLRRP